MGVGVCVAGGGGLGEEAEGQGKAMTQIRLVWRFLHFYWFVPCAVFAKTASFFSPFICSQSRGLE